jgi:mannitol-1-/sugar-/sorbitol-6-phosphatase
MKVRCRGLLLDLDGVLVDSTPAVARCWKRLARVHGFDAEEVIRRAHGRPSLATLRELLPDADHEAENREMERWEMEDISDVVALPGVVSLLLRLPPERWAIVTSCTRPLAEVRIRAGGFAWPRHLITSSDTQHGKPDPEPYIKGAASLGLASSDCIVVEDAPSGIRAGKASGARVLALRTTDADSELIAAGADWIVTDLSCVEPTESGHGDHLEFLLRDFSETQAAS